MEVWGEPRANNAAVWQDFVQWRDGRTGLHDGIQSTPLETAPERVVTPTPTMRFTGRAARILADVG